MAITSNAGLRFPASTSIGTGVPEAPNDANSYVRHALGWAVAATGGGGIADAPNDANSYVRHALGWTVGPASVFGRTGAVVAVSGDYAVAQVTGAAPLVSPALTGTPTVPTATAGASTNQVANTAFVATAVAGISGGGIADAPSDANYYIRHALGWSMAAVVAQTGGYADLTGKPTLGGAAALSVGIAAGTVAAGNDVRFSDTRAPTPNTAYDMQGQLLNQPKLQAYSEVRSTPAIVSGVCTVAYTAGNPAVITLSANVTSLVFTGLPASGTLATMLLWLLQDATGGRTVAFPASFDWGDQSAPVIASGANKETLVTILSRDGGTGWKAALGWKAA